MNRKSQRSSSHHPQRNTFQIKQISELHTHWAFAGYKGEVTATLGALRTKELKSLMFDGRYS